MELEGTCKKLQRMWKKEYLNLWKWDGKFCSKRTLKVHMKNCLDVKTYSCKDCNETFVAYADLHKHRQKVHTSAKCDYCDVGIANYKNLKRHIQLRHKDLTPNMARDLELIQISKRKKESMHDKKQFGIKNKKYDPVIVLGTESAIWAPDND